MQVPYVHQLQLGPMKNFVYLVGVQDSPEVLVVDPAWDVEAIERAAEQEGKQVVGAFVSHCHQDHINGLPQLLSRRDIPVYAQRAEVDFSQELRQQAGEALRLLGPGDSIAVGGGSFQALHTPGHTPGSHCLLAGDSLMSGDTLFINGCGRCDLRGGNPEDMYRSLTQVLARVPDQTRLWPGHDYGQVPVAPMGEVRRTNPYFEHKDLQSFVAYRMRLRE